MLSASVAWPHLLLPHILPAHGVGNRHDLPLPFPVVVIGACAALIASFAALAFLWKVPSVHDDDGLRLGALGSRVLDSTWLRVVARVLAQRSPC